MFLETHNYRASGACSSVSSVDCATLPIGSQSTRILRPSRIPISPNRRLKPPTVTISQFPSFKSKLSPKTPSFVDRLNSNKNKKTLPKTSSKTNVNMPSFTPVNKSTERRNSKNATVAKFKRRHKNSSKNLKAKESLSIQNNRRTTPLPDNRRLTPSPEIKIRSKPKKYLAVENQRDDALEFSKQKHPGTSIRRTFSRLLKKNRSATSV